MDYSLVSRILCSVSHPHYFPESVASQNPTKESATTVSLVRPSVLSWLTFPLQWKVIDPRPGNSDPTLVTNDQGQEGHNEKQKKKRRRRDKKRKNTTSPDVVLGEESSGMHTLLYGVRRLMASFLKMESFPRTRPRPSVVRPSLLHHFCVLIFHRRQTP